MALMTANDIVSGALRFINAYAAGEPLDSPDTTDALATLNDVLDSLSTSKAAVYASAENTFTYVAGQYIYTIGNYEAGTFAGTLTSGSPTITAASIPSDMIARGDLAGAGIAAGTTILSFNSGAGTVTMSANATATVPPQMITYTVPGDFKMQRPLRISNAFTRISGLDYPMDIIDQAKYVNIGYKSIPAPWPIKLWYNPTYPLGTLYFYQAPSQAATLYLYSERILTTLADLTTQFSMPQGYSLWLKRALGRAIAPEYGAIWTPMREKLHAEAKAAVESLNAQPQPTASYDPELSQNAPTDAGWIYYGGFR